MASGWRGERAEVGIVKITADVYAFMLSYCRRGFTDVYADLRFVLSAGTHCPRNYYSAVAAVFRHPRPARQSCPPPPPSTFQLPLEISNFITLCVTVILHFVFP